MGTTRIQGLYNQNRCPVGSRIRGRELEKEL